MATTYDEDSYRSRQVDEFMTWRANLAEILLICYGFGRYAVVIGAVGMMRAGLSGDRATEVR
jgi:hypothetical protein